MEMPSVNHEIYMARALQLAAQGLYSTSPNPRVGCVIVRDNRIVGEGWHRKAGEPHAEVNALRMAAEQAKGATAYVTLEPCSHYGRTPPCALGLIEAGVSRVVAACADPNPLVAGRGFKRLREAGIEVIESCLATQAEALNSGFMKRMRTGMPLVRIKLAQSLDGRTAMANGESQWITGAAARQDVQRLRARSCAIITGADSVLLDNPSMTVRPAEAGIELDADLWRQPLRVLVDGQLRVGNNARLLQATGNILVASTRKPNAPLLRPAQAGRIDYWLSPAVEQLAHVDLGALLRHLGTLGMNEVLIETGARLAGAFIEQQLVDELIVYTAPTLLGSDARPLLQLPLTHMSEQIRWHWQDVRMVGQDLRLTLIPARGENS
jgi:diaminohydroxyphosphoribosylaminopyrimidine deaminase / 5-amino-6-(5-phosphoribosylamino)uracil reductase